ncbi:hypothetical protein JCM15060_22320 [Halanaerobaculum tunisiense]
MLHSIISADHVPLVNIATVILVTVDDKLKVPFAEPATEFACTIILGTNSIINPKENIIANGFQSNPFFI